MDQNVKNKISTIESPNSEKRQYIPTYILLVHYVPLVNFTQVIFLPN